MISLSKRAQRLLDNLPKEEKSAYLSYAERNPGINHELEIPGRKWADELEEAPETPAIRNSEPVVKSLPPSAPLPPKPAPEAPTQAQEVLEGSEKTFDWAWSNYPAHNVSPREITRQAFMRAVQNEEEGRMFVAAVKKYRAATASTTMTFKLLRFIEDGLWRDYATAGSAIKGPEELPKDVDGGPAFQKWVYWDVDLVHAPILNEMIADLKKEK